MAAEPKYTAQFSVVATQTMGRLFTDLAETVPTDKSKIARLAADLWMGLDDGELADGETYEQALDRLREKFREHKGAPPAQA